MANHTNAQAQVLAIAGPGPHVVAGVVTKPMKPLNSWLAFRAYFSDNFRGCMQKDISRYVTCLWQKEPFQDRYAILAKAYSIIRDSQGVRNSNLRIFMGMAAPIMNVIQPNVYFMTFGFFFVQNLDGTLNLLQDDTTYDLVVGALRTLNTSTVSCQDVIDHCITRGYVHNHNLTIPNGVPQLAMAVTSDSTSQVRQPEMPTSPPNFKVMPAPALQGFELSYDVDSKGFTNVLGASTSPLDKFSTSANWIAAPGDPHPVYLSKQPTQAFILKEKGKLQAAGRLGLTVTPSAHLKVDSPANMLFVDKSPSASYGAIPVFDPTYGDLYNAYNITELVEDPKYYVDEDDVFESRLI